MRRLGTNWAGIKPKPVVIDGIRFPSSSEGRRYAALKLEECARLIRGLKVHEKLPLVINGKKIGRGWLEIDFVYERLERGAWWKVYEDHKAVMTREAQQRIQMAEAVHGIKIEITGGKTRRRAA
jgi:hypothetical protein